MLVLGPTINLRSQRSPGRECVESNDESRLGAHPVHASKSPSSNCNSLSNSSFPRSCLLWVQISEGLELTGTNFTLKDRQQVEATYRLPGLLHALSLRQTATTTMPLLPRRRRVQAFLAVTKERKVATLAPTMTAAATRSNQETEINRNEMVCPHLLFCLKWILPSETKCE